MEKLFDAYYTQNKENNMGIGLTIYQRIIKIHGGRIIVLTHRQINMTINKQTILFVSSMMINLSVKVWNGC